MAALSVVLLAAAADPVIAERGRDQITVSQARAMISTADPETRRRLTTDSAALKEFLRSVLVQRAVLEEAQAAKWDQKPEVVSLLARTRDQVIAQSFLASQAVPPPSYPSEAEIQAAYTQNKAQFMQPRGFHLAQLYTPKPAAGAADDGRAKLVALRARMDRTHVAMADVAQRDPAVKYMDMGWASEKQLLPVIKESVAGLQEGATAGPVCVENGCHLIRLIATRPAGPTPLLEVREALVRALRGQKQAELERTYAAGLLARQPAAIDEIQLSRMAP